MPGYIYGDFIRHQVELRSGAGWAKSEPAGGPEPTWPTASLQRVKRGSHVDLSGVQQWHSASFSTWQN